MMENKWKNVISSENEGYKVTVEKEVPQEREGKVVYWIVTEGNDKDLCEDGEFGVEVNGEPFFYYKWSDAQCAPSDIKYRRITKREFGEVIRRPAPIDGRRL